MRNGIATLPILIVVIGVIVVYVLISQQIINISSVDKLPVPGKSQLQDTISLQYFEVLDTTLTVPDKLVTEEGVAGLKIFSETGEIKIGRTATNFENLSKYFEYHPDEPLSRMKNYRPSTINSYDSVNGVIEDRYNYYIYVDNWVYILSTSEPSLYPDLDQIAQSFRYTPSE